MESILRRVLPGYDFRIRHSRHIAAEPAEVWAAMSRITPADLPITGLLMGVRLAGGLLRPRPELAPGAARPGELRSGAGRPAPNRWRAPIAESGRLPLIGRAPGRELVFGKIGQFWRLRPVDLPVPDLATFAGFTEPGWVKAAVSIEVVPAAGGSVLSTETRVLATDPAARRRFRPYWLLITTFGMRLIRREILAAIARRTRAARAAAQAGARP